jgi:hypothetical protein
VTNTFDAARDIINSALGHPDPEGALERLEAEAPEDEKFMFVMLWEGLALALNDKPR